jgi:hypothetical protein
LHLSGGDGGLFDEGLMHLLAVLACPLLPLGYGTFI